MNKELLTQLFYEALEKDVSFSLHFAQYQFNGEDTYPVNKVDAQALVHQFAEAIGTSDVIHNVGQEYADDFVIDSNKFRICCSYVPNQEEKEAGKRKRIAELEKELEQLKSAECETV
jgi:hypothetical protein